MRPHIIFPFTLLPTNQWPPKNREIQSNIFSFSLARCRFVWNCCRWQAFFINKFHKTFKNETQYTFAFLDMRCMKYFWWTLFIMMVFTQNKWGKKTYDIFYTFKSRKTCANLQCLHYHVHNQNSSSIKSWYCVFYYFHIAFSAKSFPGLMNGQLLTRHQRVKLCGPNSESLYPKFLNPNFWSSIKIYFIKNEIRSSLSPLSNHVTFADKP